MHYVYAIKSAGRNYIYVGMTQNPTRRVAEHNAGKERTTRAFRPFSIVRIEEYPTRNEARSREKYLKSGIGKEFLKSLL